MPKVLLWKEHKDELYSLYVVQNRTLRDIIGIMNSEYQFHARYNTHKAFKYLLMEIICVQQASIEVTIGTVGISGAGSSDTVK